MAVVDIILLLCFIPAIVQGLGKGFVKQVIGIVAIFAGAWAAFKFSGLLTGWLSSYIQANGAVMQVVSFAIVAVLVILLLMILGNLLTHLLKDMSLGIVNRVLGLVFSLFKALLIMGIFIMIFESLNGTFHFLGEDILDNAPLYCAVKSFALKVFPYLKSLVAGTVNV